jgi:endonuclease YncB( thermonuclease family)
MENLHLYNKDTPLFSLNNLKTYGRVVDITDGDTINCVIPLFNGKYYKFNFRLNGIDTCEMKSKNEKNKELAIAARDLLFELITNNKSKSLSKQEISDILNEKVYLVWIECSNFDKFGRVLANVSLNENSLESFSNILINKKLAYNYHGEKKLSEDEQLMILTEEVDKSH